MAVRAKAKCIQSENGKIRLEAVCDGSEENKTFFRYTPSLQVNMGTVNEAAANQFEVGKEYYIDFTPAN